MTDQRLTQAQLLHVAVLPTPLRENDGHKPFGRHGTICDLPKPPAYFMITIGLRQCMCMSCYRHTTHSPRIKSTVTRPESRCSWLREQQLWNLNKTIGVGSVLIHYTLFLLQCYFVRRSAKGRKCYDPPTSFICRYPNTWLISLWVYFQR